MKRQPCIIFRKGPLICYLIFILFQAGVHAQYENVWIFGKNAGLDFNGTTPKAITSNITTGIRSILCEASASVCNENGELLFYTEGTRVFNRQHNIMPNGDSLIPILFLSNTLITSTISTSQGAIIVPIPGSPYQYYIFSLTANEMGQDAGRLYYTIVDMSRNFGLGDVVGGQKGIFLDSNLTEHMTAVAGNCSNIWLLTASSKNKEIRAYNVASSGISRSPVLSKVAGLGSNYPDSATISGCMIVSPNRNKVAIGQVASYYRPILGNGLLLLDFNPATGLLANEQQLCPMGSGSGVCFSPDNTKLYFNQVDSGINGFREIYQFDLSAGTLANIMNSKTMLVPGYNATHLKLAPDNKIYFGIGNSGAHLSTINAPNQPGLNCQVQPNNMPLLTGTAMGVGLPNVVAKVLPLDTLYTTTDYAECGTSLVIQASSGAGENYIWNDGAGTATRTVSRSGTYRVSYKTDCAYHVDVFEVALTQPVHYSFTQVFCSGKSFDFNGVQLNRPGIYQDTLVAANGCDSVVTLDLVAIPGQEVSILLAQNNKLCIGDTVSISAEGSKYYLWYLNEKLVDSGSIAHLYFREPLNNILLIGISENDCRDSVTAVLKADACCDLFIPNAFSPNGDAINDGFGAKPYGNLRKYVLAVFNRWGQRIFSTFDINKQWDGTYNGINTEPGTYFYQVSAECIEGTEINFKGDLTLIR